MNDAVDLSGRSVLVTGGSMGIGFAVARACLEAGARVTICARGRDDLEAAVAALREHAMRDDAVLGVAADVSDSGSVTAAFDRAQAAFGTVTGVVHAAAVLDAIGSILDADPREWLRVVEINLYGTFLVAREACSRMRAGRANGRVVLFSGGGAGSPYPNFTAYGCSKAAVVRFAETIAIEMRPFGIEVNALAPGLVATRMVEKTRASHLGGPPAAAISPDVAGRAAAYLISDAAAGITGKFVAPAYDDYRQWPQHLDRLRDTDVFTLRRIVPKDRGMEWQ